MMSEHGLKYFATAISLSSAISATAATKELERRDDHAPVTLSGVLVSVDSDDFVLDYGSGSVTVDLSEWDRSAHDLLMEPGYEVTVFGEIDKHLFTSLTISADAIYLKDLGSYAYAKSTDVTNRGFVNYLWSEPDRYRASDMTVRGKVVGVDTADRSFTVAIGGGEEIQIETDLMEYDPTASGKRNPVDAGDWVRVSGRVDNEFFGGRVIRADAVTTVYEDADANS